MVTEPFYYKLSYLQFIPYQHDPSAAS